MYNREITKNLIHERGNMKQKTKTRPEQRLGYFMVLIAGCLWGTNGFFVSILNDLGVQSSTVAFLRLAVAAIILAVMMLIMEGKKLFKIDKYGLLACLALGVFSQALFNYSYNEAIEHVGVALACILAYTAPIFVCIMSRLFFKEKIGPVKILALIVNIFGCVLTVTGGNFTSIKFSVYGAGAAVLAGFLFALMTIISTTTTSYHPLTILFYSFVFGAITLGAIARPWNAIAQAASLPLLFAVLGYCLIATVGSYFVYLRGLAKKLETSKVPVVTSVETVVATCIGVFVFHEALGFVKLIGIGLVLASIVIMNMVKPK